MTVLVQRPPQPADDLAARSVARHLGCRPGRLLVRAPGPPQTGRTRDERLDGPAFRARGRVPRRVLVVDDVVTTGATLTAAAVALRRAGATRVVAATVARTPESAAGHVTTGHRSPGGHAR